MVSLAALVALLVLLLPGMLVAWGLGIHGALRLVAAPALSLGVWSGAVWIATGLHLPWKVWLVLPLLALIVVPFVIGRLTTLRPGMKATWPQTPATALSKPLWLAAGVGAVLCAAPFVIGTGFLTRVPQTWDMVFHLSAVRYTRELASSSPWISLAPVLGDPAYYPNVFHNITALLPGSPVQAYLGITLAMLILWPVLMGAFTLLASSGWRGNGTFSQTAALFAILGAAMGATFPISSVANLATPPYTLSLIATPGVLILTIAFWRLRPSRNYLLTESGEATDDSEDAAAATAADFSRNTIPLPKFLAQMFYSAQLAPWLALGIGVSLAGLVSTHPSSLFNLMVLLGPSFVVLMWRGWRAWKTSPVWKLSLPLTIVALLLGGMWFFLYPRLRSMSRFANPNDDTSQLLWKLVVDYPKGPFSSGFGWGGAVFFLAALYGLIAVVAARRLLWLPSGLVTAIAFFIFATDSRLLGSLLTAPWYVQPYRLAPLVWICVFPLAGLGFAALSSRLSVLTNRSETGIVIFLVLVLIAGNEGAALPGRTAVVRGSYNPPEILNGTMMTTAEQHFITENAPKLTPDAVIWGAPHTGTPFWWILGGRHVVLNNLTWPQGENLELMKDFYDRQLSEKGCRYLKRLGVTHYYEDNDQRADGAKYGQFHWNHRYRKSRFRPPDANLTLLAAHDDGGHGGFHGQRLFRFDFSCD